MKVRWSNCNETHFERLNFTMTASLKQKINERLCPILDSDYDKLMLKNDQTHTGERKFVGIKARKCQPGVDDVDGNKCKSNEDIEKLLNNLIWTYYMAVGTAKLGDQSLYDKSPIVPIDTFFK